MHEPMRGETARATFEEHPQARWPGMVLSQVVGPGLHHQLWAVPVHWPHHERPLRGLPLTPPRGLRPL